MDDVLLHEWPSATAPRRRWWKRLLWGGVSLLLTLAIGGFICIKLVEREAQKELDAVIAELDAVDPQWRLEDIEAARKVIPDEENAALVVMEIVARLPKPYQAKPLYQSISELAPEDDLEPMLYWELRSELGRVAVLLPQARSLARLSEGRYPITYSTDYFSTKVPCQDWSEVVSLLQMDALLRAREEDIDGALVAVRAMFVAARSIGDEPLMVSQLVRMACRNVGVLSLERTLAQGQPSESALARLQRFMENEESVRLLEIALRGERAGSHAFLEGIASGKVKLSEFFAYTGAGSGSGSNTLKDFWVNSVGALMAKRERAAVLRSLTECVEASRLPPKEQEERFAQIDQTARRERSVGTIFVGLLVPGMAKVASSSARSQAGLRCAIAALAAERFRLANQRWPKDLADLVPGYLKQVPADPYDGKALRLRELEDGIVIYSIGPDLEDNGGAINRQNPVAPGSDLGFRLWNVDARRKPALNPDVGPPRPTEEELRMMDWMMPPAGQEAPPEEPNAERPPP